MLQPFLTKIIYNAWMKEKWSSIPSNSPCAKNVGAWFLMVKVSNTHETRCILSVYFESHRQVAIGWHDACLRVKMSWYHKIEDVA